MFKNPKIDINCDLGEGKSLLDCETDSLLMPYISSCNIACGGHAGNENIMSQTLRNAQKNGIKIGAHPGYPDKENFGRLSISITDEELIDSLKTQIDHLIHIGKKMNISIHHIKFHGALYNDMEINESLAKRVAKFCKKDYPTIKILGLAGGNLHRYCQEQALSFITEGFMDRLYLANGQLTSRSHLGAVIENKEAVISQALALAQKKPIKTKDQQFISPDIQSICLHGDNPNAYAIAKTLFSYLKKEDLI